MTAKELTEKNPANMLLLDRIPLSGKIPYKEVDYTDFKEIIKPIDQRTEKMFVDALSKQLLDDTEQQIKEIRKKIWDYMAEHPTKDNGMLISPVTHDLIIEELDYHTDENYCHWIYVKRFHFELKDRFKWPECEEKINEQNKAYDRIRKGCL